MGKKKLIKIRNNEQVTNIKISIEDKSEFSNPFYVDSNETIFQKLRGKNKMNYDF